MNGEDSFYQTVSDPARFREAIRQFDELNAADPHREMADGALHPREWLNARRLCCWLMRLAPEASEALRLAARSQHLCRWEIPRTRYDMTRTGYLQWRTELKKFHAEKSAAVLRAVGYDETMVTKVRELNLKKNFPGDRDSRVLEDALCLVFLEFQLANLADKTSEEKVVNALKKSWSKMTPAAHAQALKLNYRPQDYALIQRALS